MISLNGHFFMPRWYVPLVILVVLLSLPFLVDAYFLNLFIMIYIYGALGGSWNLIGGYGGQMSLGHAVYFGIGAYVPTILGRLFDMSPWIGMFAGIAVSFVVALAIGSICFRLRGHYFAISTIILLEVTRLLCLRERWLTEGGVGLSVPYKGNSVLFFQFLDKTPYYYIAFFIVLVVIYLNARLSKSRMGYQLRAVGQNQEAAEVIGINSAKIKKTILAQSAVLTSICGTFWVQYMYFIDPDIAFGLAFSIEIALIAIIGGMGTVWGPFLGALVLRPVVEITSSTLGGTYAGIHLIVYSLILILVVLFRPEGLISLLGPLYKKILHKLPGAMPAGIQTRSEARNLFE